ncbi:hypothetical protein P6166_08705 [Stenotrophomonas sp. HITSZ_GD]|uniref:hypothetical protein n=1 Tax=Stenotrophomonas sp. HITSZ_GD TaxID=3037248 RepID=UPI00240CE790|nr:hypothetical protein [Stenotrophomonas sp. HITSZ_GD]MDG2525431.1 hypothetical protein [Stenotrophomonas sp. HITSZ_GD]
MLVTLMSIRLTLCGSNVCLGRNLITVFFTVNTPAKIFFVRPPPPPPPGTQRHHPGRPRARAPMHCIFATHEKKPLLFSCIFFGHANSKATMPRRAHACAHPVRRPTARNRWAKIFSAKAAFAASHRAKCANFSRPTNTLDGEDNARAMRARTPRAGQRARAGASAAARRTIAAATGVRPLAGSRANKNGRFRGRFRFLLAAVKNQ